MTEPGETIELPRPWPRHIERLGQFIALEPLNACIHAPELFEAGHSGHDAFKIWDYLPYGPFEGLDAYRKWLLAVQSRPDPQFYALRDKCSGKASGVCSFLRIEPAHGVIEIGHIWYGPQLQKTSGATEAMFLLFEHVFDELGYRRLEWKCNAANKASRHAALRLGFSFEGIFRQHLVVKGRNRDSAWFSILDKEWPAVRKALSAWLEPSNQINGKQVRTLAQCGMPNRSQ